MYYRYGTVYRALWKGAPVAVKVSNVPSRQLAGEPQQLQQLQKQKQKQRAKPARSTHREDFDKEVELICAYLS